MGKGLQEPKVICVVCLQAEIVYGLTSIDWKLAESSLVVKNIPARVCPACGEAFLDEDIAIRLLQNAHEISEAGRTEMEFEFSQRR